MLKIKIEDIDKLSSLCNDLSALTFLQGLIVSDDYIDYGEEYSFIYTYTRECLHEKQKEQEYKEKPLIFLLCSFL